MSVSYTHLAKAKGLDAKVSEVHGMAQRGGSVVTHVRIGENVASPLIDVQSADVLLSFEPVEALRALEMLKPGGMLICDESQVPPIAVNMGTAAYPKDVKEQVAAYTDRYIFVDATGIAREPVSYTHLDVYKRQVLRRISSSLSALFLSYSFWRVCWCYPLFPAARCRERLQRS